LEELDFRVKAGPYIQKSHVDFYQARAASGFYRRGTWKLELQPGDLVDYQRTRGSWRLGQVLTIHANAFVGVTQLGFLGGKVLYAPLQSLSIAVPFQFSNGFVGPEPFKWLEKGYEMAEVVKEMRDVEKAGKGEATKEKVPNKDNLSFVSQKVPEKAADIILD